LRLRCLFLPCPENDFKPLFLRSRFLIYYAVLLLVLKFAILPVFIYLPKTGFFADITKTSLIQLTNTARQELGVLPLKESEKLDQAAYSKAMNMLQEGYFAHNSPEGTTPWFWFEKVGYDYRYAGENLAIGFLESDEVNQAWLDSASHRKNIVNGNYSEIGIAVVNGNFKGAETTVVVQLFGSPRSVAVANKTEVLPQALTVEKTEIVGETTTEKISQNNQESQPKIVLSAYDAAEKNDDSMLKIVSFFASDYYTIIQYIIFVSLILIILLLINTVLFDIFVYRAYEIQHKDIILKTISFCLVLAILLNFDQTAMIQLIPHDFRIY
jgi:hypothetical protein